MISAVTVFVLLGGKREARRREDRRHTEGDRTQQCQNNQKN